MAPTIRPRLSATTDVAAKCVHCRRLQYNELGSSGGHSPTSRCSETPSPAVGGRRTISASIDLFRLTGFDMYLVIMFTTLSIFTSTVNLGYQEISCICMF